MEMDFGELRGRLWRKSRSPLCPPFGAVVLRREIANASKTSEAVVGSGLGSTASLLIEHSLDNTHQPTTERPDSYRSLEHSRTEIKVPGHATQQQTPSRTTHQEHSVSSIPPTQTLNKNYSLARKTLMDSRAGPDIIRRYEHISQYREEKLEEIDSPCASMQKQDRRVFLEKMLEERRMPERIRDKLKRRVNNTHGLREERKSLPRGFGLLAAEDFGSLRSFVFFVGWQRSGHSIIGSLLDGHPDAVIAHEFYLFGHLHEFTSRRRRGESSPRVRLFNMLAANSYRHSRYGDRSEMHNKKGYNLRVAGSWQGCFRRLRIIGDKAAGEVTNIYRWNTTNFIHHVTALKSLVKLPLKVINVVRNPFDMIATLSLYRGSHIVDVKVKASPENKYDDQTVIQGATNTILDKARHLHRMEEDGYDWELIRIHSEDFIRDPKSVMRELCVFLGLECSEDYLQLCADKTFKSTSKSREVIEWDPVIKKQVEESIREIPFFSQYSFESD